MCVATRNGLKVAYHDSGGDAPAVVLSHGFAMDHHMFDQQVLALQSDYRVVTWDQRGFGGTLATAPFTFWDSARDLLMLMDHLGIERATLCGMSQGGFVSLRATLIAPSRVRGLILLDTQAGLEDRSGPDEIIAIWKESGARQVQDRLAGAILGPGEWGDWYEKWSTMDLQQLDWAYECLMEREDLTQRLLEIRCPALIVHGTHDVAVPLERAKVMRAGLGGTTSFVAIEGGPHAANITHPVEVNEAIRSFLANLAP
jgi:3-oxoadipate enol-lactonase